MSIIQMNPGPYWPLYRCGGPLVEVARKRYSAAVSSSQHTKRTKHSVSHSVRIIAVPPRSPHQSKLKYVKGNTSHTSHSLHSHARDMQRVPRSQTRVRVAISISQKLVTSHPPLAEESTAISAELGRAGTRARKPAQTPVPKCYCRYFDVAERPGPGPWRDTGDGPHGKRDTAMELCQKSHGFILTVNVNPIPNRNPLTQRHPFSHHRSPQPSSSLAS